MRADPSDRDRTNRRPSDSYVTLSKWLAPLSLVWARERKMSSGSLGGNVTTRIKNRNFRLKNRPNLNLLAFPFSLLLPQDAHNRRRRRRYEPTRVTTIDDLFPREPNNIRPVPAARASRAPPPPKPFLLERQPNDLLYFYLPIHPKSLLFFISIASQSCIAIVKADDDDDKHFHESRLKSCFKRAHTSRVVLL